MRSPLFTFCVAAQVPWRGAPKVSRTALIRLVTIEKEEPNGGDGTENGMGELFRGARRRRAPAFSPIWENAEYFVK